MVRSRGIIANPLPAHSVTKRHLLLSLVPLAVPVLLCLFSLCQRAVLASRTEQPFGRMTQSDACNAASRFLQTATGRNAQILESSRQAAFSRQRTLVREWDVTCRVQDREYLLRINAESGRIFGVNRVAAPAGAPGVSQKRALTVAQAEMAARGYLKTLGVPVEKAVNAGQHKDSVIDSGAPAWTFSYRLDVANRGERLLAVSIDATDGDLICAWNPAFAM